MKVLTKENFVQNFSLFFFHVIAYEIKVNIIHHKAKTNVPDCAMIFLIVKELGSALVGDVKTLICGTY